MAEWLTVPYELYYMVCPSATFVAFDNDISIVMCEYLGDTTNKDFADESFKFCEDQHEIKMQVFDCM